MEPEDPEGGAAMFEFLKKDVLEENASLKARITQLEHDLMSIAAPMVVVGENMATRSVNDATLEVAGYGGDEAVGKMTCAQFSKTSLCGTANCTLKNCMRTGEVIYRETFLQTRQ